MKIFKTDKVGERICNIIKQTYIDRKYEEIEKEDKKMIRRRNTIRNPPVAKDSTNKSLSPDPSTYSHKQYVLKLTDIL